MRDVPREYQIQVEDVHLYHGDAVRLSVGVWRSQLFAPI
jgi:hypothetical protein